MEMIGAAARCEMHCDREYGHGARPVEVLIRRFESWPGAPKGVLVPSDIGALSPFRPLHSFGRCPMAGMPRAQRECPEGFLGCSFSVRLMGNEQSLRF